MLITSFSTPKHTVGVVKKDLHVSPNGNVRLDTWINLERKGTQAKISHFGKQVIPGKMLVKDFIYSETDSKGEVVDFSSSIIGNGFLHGSHVDQRPWNFVDSDGQRVDASNRLDLPPIIDIDGSDINIRIDSIVGDNAFLPVEADIFEDDMNAPFALYGMALAAMTVCAMHSPYAAFMIMDSKLGFDMKSITKLSGSYGASDVAIVNNLRDMGKFMSRINMGFADASRRHESDLRVHAYVHPFGCVVDIFDKQNPYLKFRNHVNISDHCRILRTIEARDRSYQESQLFEEINKFKYPSAYTSLFDSSDEKSEFSHGMISGNFISEWNERRN